MTSTFSTRGEWRGNVRSTPTPYEMRRTVNEARRPSPRLRMTVPSNTWVRSFSPSMTLTCTRTRSPGSKPWRSFLSCPASTSRIASMILVPFSLRGRIQCWRRLPAFEPLDPLPLLARQLRALEQVRPRPPCLPQRLPPAPALDARMIPRQRHRRHPRAAEVFGPRVLRRLQQPARERLALGGALGPQHARQQPRHGVRHHQRGQLAAREHVVADRDGVVGEQLAHPLV